jgi:hypothetical protein
MALATTLDYIDLKLVGDRVTWTYEVVTDLSVVVSTKNPTVRSMYSRLARQYDARPSVRNSGGGLPGDLIPL